MSDRPCLRRSGQALIETTLILPLLLALFLGLSFVLRIAHAKVVLLEAARCGAAVEAAGGAGEKAAKDYLLEELQNGQVEVEGVRVDHGWPLATIVVEGSVLSPVPGQDTVKVRVSAGIGTTVAR